MSKEKESYQDNIVPTQQVFLYPKEQRQLLGKKHKKLFIGIPKEKSPTETRVALVPKAVALLVNNGHQVRIESNAGKAAHFADKDYSEVGAQICYSHKEVFQADIVLKIEPPTLEELDYMIKGKALISAIQMAQLQAPYLRKLMEKKLTALAFELIQEKTGMKPVVRTMSEIAGSTVMLIAAEYLSSVNDEGRGIILGGITGVPPSKVLIIGAGTVGEYAARAAIGLGAELKIFDRSIYRLRRIKYAIGHQVYTATLDSDLLAEAVSRADVVIGAMRAEGTRAPFVVTEEMVSKMKPNSILVDVSIDQGGCFETSKATNHARPVYKKYDVIHYAVPNIAARVAHTSSTALSNIFAPYLVDMGNYGGIDDMIFANPWFMKGVYAYKGSITHTGIAARFQLPHKDLSLLMAARM